MLTDNYIQKSSDADNQISAKYKISLLVEFKDYSDIFSDEDTSILLKLS